MINTTLTRKAMTIAYNAHMNQLDRAGVPYIFHPIHIAEKMDDEISCICALLHDVVEDTKITFEDLKKDFPKEVIDILKLLTHENGVDYMDYIKGIKQNKIATKVKVVDIRHNSDPSRLDFVSEEDVKRAEKYKKALRILLG